MDPGDRFSAKYLKSKRHFNSGFVRR